LRVQNQRQHVLGSRQRSVARYQDTVRGFRAREIAAAL
jgi:hypothetical protein